jgi:hypothetical protein
MSEIVSRRMAETTVDLFLEVIHSLDSDAGWRGDNLIGKLMDFKGDLPQSSGFSGFSKVWEQSAFLRNWSDAHKMACVLMRRLSDRKREALAVDRAYRGRVKVAIDPFNADDEVEIHCDDDYCAYTLECSADAFRRRVSDAYSQLERMLSESAQRIAA